MIFWIILGVIILLAIVFLIAKYKMQWFFVFFGKDAMEIAKVVNKLINNRISAVEYKDEVTDLIVEHQKNEKKKIRKRKLEKIFKKQN